MKQYKYKTVVGTENKVVHATSVSEAARQIAYWYSTKCYGKNAIIVDCNELFVNNVCGEFETKVGKVDKNNKFFGHCWRFSVYKIKC